MELACDVHAHAERLVREARQPSVGWAVLLAARLPQEIDDERGVEVRHSGSAAAGSSVRAAITSSTASSVASASPMSSRARSSVEPVDTPPKCLLMTSEND